MKYEDATGRYKPKFKQRTDEYYQKRELEITQATSGELEDEWNRKLSKIDEALRGHKTNTLFE